MVKRQKDDIVRKDVGQDYDKKKVLSLSKMNTERRSIILVIIRRRTRI